MFHKFKIGQRVRRAQSSPTDERLGFGTISEVVRLMPDDPHDLTRAGFQGRGPAEGLGGQGDAAGLCGGDVDRHRVIVAQGTGGVIGRVGRNRTSSSSHCSVTPIRE